MIMADGKKSDREKRAHELYEEKKERHTYSDDELTIEEAEKIIRDHEEEEEKQKLSAKVSGIGKMHFVYIIVILIIIAVMIAVLVHKNQKYGILENSYALKADELSAKDTQIDELNSQISAASEELANFKQASGTKKCPLTKEKELAAANKQISDLKKQLAGNQTCDDCSVLVGEYKDEYNTGLEKMYDDMKEACTDLTIGKNPTDKDYLENQLDLEIDIDKYKAGAAVS